MHTITLQLLSHPFFLFFLPPPFPSLSLPLLKKFSIQIQVEHLGQLISSGTRLAGYCWQDVWAGPVFSVGIPNTHKHTHTYTQTDTQRHSFNLISRCSDSWRHVDENLCGLRDFKGCTTKHTAINSWLNATFNIFRNALVTTKMGYKICTGKAIQHVVLLRWVHTLL